MNWRVINEGTGINGAKDRSRIPDALCDYIVKLCENNQTEQE